MAYLWILKICVLSVYEVWKCMVDDRTFPSSKVESDQDVSVENNTLPLLPAIYVNEIIGGNFQGVQIFAVITNHEHYTTK